MTVIRIEGDQLVVQLRGLDPLLALRRRLSIPLAHVRGATPDPGYRPPLIRRGGTHVPGLVTAGQYLRGHEREFWNVKRPSRTVVIELRDEHFDRLVLEADDPRALADQIEGAIAS